MARLVNYIFIFVIVFLFVLEATASDHLRILLAVALSLILSVSAFFLKWITLDGITAAVVFGTIALGLGGWVMAILVLLFFITGSLLSRDMNIQVKLDEHNYYSSKLKFRRDGKQVWSNGFWVALFVVLWFLLNAELFLIAAVASLAASTADTWATEVGRKRNTPTILITNFKHVDPGTDGGISLKGTISAIAGTAMIAAAFSLLRWDFDLTRFMVILVSGFSGCIADSYLGAVFQQPEKNKYHWFHKYFKSHSEANNAVNWAASGVGGLMAIILIQWI